MWKTTFLILLTLLFALTQAEGKPENPVDGLSAISPDTIRPPTLVNCPDYPGPGYHIVQPGQTLYAISRAYEIPIQSLIHWNNISDPDQIEVCQKIWLRKPGAESIAPATYSTTSDQSPRSITSLPVAKRQDAYWGNTSERRINARVETQSNPPVGNPAPLSHYDIPDSYSTIPAASVPAMSPPSDCRDISGPGYHIVQSGETLASIAKMYGVNEAELKRINNIKPADRLKKCRRLDIPAVATYSKKDNNPIYIPPVVGPTPSLATSHDQDPLKPTPYLVQKAESLVSFAARMKTNPQDLAWRNNLPIDAQLRPGQSLILPSDRNR